MSADLTPAELLEKGAAYIEEHGLWQGAYYEDAMLDFAEAGQRGVSACAMGALNIISGSIPASSQALLALRLQIDCPLTIWNDAPGRTAGEVADAMRNAATKVRGAAS